MPVGIVRAIEEMREKIGNVGEVWSPLSDDPNMLCMITEKGGELMIHFRTNDWRYKRGFVFKSCYEVDYEKEGLIR